MILRFFALATALLCTRLLAVKPLLLDLLDCAREVTFTQHLISQSSSYSGDASITLIKKKEDAEDTVIISKSFLKNQSSYRKKFLDMSELRTLEDILTTMKSPYNIVNGDYVPAGGTSPKVSLTFKGWRRFPDHSMPGITQVMIDECERIFYYPYKLHFPDIEAISFYVKGFVWPLLKMPQSQMTQSAGSIVETPSFKKVAGFFSNVTEAIFSHNDGTYKHRTFYEKIPNLRRFSYPKAYLGIKGCPFDATVSLDGLLDCPQKASEIHLSVDNTIDTSSLQVALPTWCETHLDTYHQLFVGHLPQDKAEDSGRVPLAVCLMALPDPAMASLFSFLRPGEACPWYSQSLRFCHI